jgi:hypothetical protein
MEADMEKCERRANHLLDDGKAFDYIHAVWCKRSRSNPLIGKALLISKGCQSVTNSKGLHVQINGDAGYGKTWSIECMRGIMPAAGVWDSDLSDRALYYPTNDMKDGMVMYVDDINWTDKLGVSIKRTISKYQTGAKSSVVDELQGKVAQTRKRLAFWVTSVDSQADEQIRDRLFTFSVKAGSDRAKEIIVQMKKVDRGEGIYFNQDHILTCKLIFSILQEQHIDVLIPFEDEDIEFTGDPRAYGVFADMVKGITIFNYRRREVVNGKLIAQREDVEAAAELYNAMGGHDPNKFSLNEQAVIDALLAMNCSATKKQIISYTGFDGATVSHIINGRGNDPQKRNGLIAKCGLSVRNWQGEKMYDLDKKSLPRQASHVQLAWLRPEHPRQEYEPCVMPDFLKTHDGKNTYFDPETATCQ